jgi:hypothetical protein
MVVSDSLTARDLLTLMVYLELHLFSDFPTALDH